VQVELRAGMQRVLVVDDHAVIRKGTQSILGAWPEWQVSGEAANGEEAVLLTNDLKPDIVLMDISMPGMGGLQATRAIRKVCPDAKVLMLTSLDSLECVQTALHAGARGYLLKSHTEGELMCALNVVAGNGIYASPGLDPDRLNRMVLQLGLIV
jgi:DNA-binding NarL/FixJ family response regulator